MRRMQYVLAVMTVAALGTLVTYAQAPQQPPAGSTGPGSSWRCGARARWPGGAGVILHHERRQG